MQKNETVSLCLFPKQGGSGHYWNNFLSLVGTDLCFFTSFFSLNIHDSPESFLSPGISIYVLSFMVPDCLCLDPIFATSLLCDLECVVPQLTHVENGGNAGNSFIKLRIK